MQSGGSRLTTLRTCNLHKYKRPAPTQHDKVHRSLSVDLVAIVALWPTWGEFIRCGKLTVIIKTVFCFLLVYILGIWEFYKLFDITENITNNSYLKMLRKLYSNSIQTFFYEYSYLIYNILTYLHNSLQGKIYGMYSGKCFEASPF